MEVMTSKVDTFLDKFEELTFEPTKNKDDNFSVKFDKAQLKVIKEVVKNWVGNPTQYTKDGKFMGGSNPLEIVEKAVYAQFGREMVEKNYMNAMKLKDITRAEEIAKVKPDRKPKVGEGGGQGLSEEKQQEMIIRKKKVEEVYYLPVTTFLTTIYDGNRIKYI
jgi:hypothetical protein